MLHLMTKIIHRQRVRRNANVKIRMGTTNLRGQQRMTVFTHHTAKTRQRQRVKVKKRKIRKMTEHAVSEGVSQTHKNQQLNDNDSHANQQLHVSHENMQPRRKQLNVSQANQRPRQKVQRRMQRKNASAKSTDPTTYVGCNTLNNPREGVSRTTPT